MGYYIPTSEAKNKAAYIIKNYDARPVVRPHEFGDIKENEALIVVIDNGFFEAAGFAFDESEFKAFTDPSDVRGKGFLLMDLKKARELSGYK